MAKYLVIDCGAQRFAVPRALVSRRVRASDLEVVPRMPPWLCGAGHVAGRVLSVIDVAVLLGDAAAVRRPEWVSVLSERGPIVLAVDSAVDSEGTEAASGPAAGGLASGWVNIGAQAVGVLSLEKLWARLQTPS